MSIIDSTRLHRLRAVMCGVFALCFVSACNAYDRDRYAELTDVRDAMADRSDVANDALADTHDVIDREDVVDEGVDAAGDASDVSVDGSTSCDPRVCTAPHLCCGSACVDPTNDGANCGSCGHACAHTVCSSGTCTNACVFGFLDCNGNLADGCEASIVDDVANCGRCGNTCNAAHATNTCESGTCGFTCAAGFGDCDGDPANGCETDLSSSAANCGTCANACSGGANQVASCSAGACSVRCAPGFADCDANAATGCETNLSLPSNCGACRATCTATAPVCAPSMGGGFACTTGCAPGLSLCAGACVALAADPMNCGMCGHVCTAPGGGSALCNNGACGTSCPTGQSLCSGMCASTQTTANCGSCGNACTAPANATPTCTSAGTCGFTCNAGCTLAGGACICSIAAPRAIAPLSTSIVTNNRPTLRWTLAGGTDGAVVTLCRDRAMTASCTAITATGSSARPSSALARGWWYWRLAGRLGMQSGTATSPVWQFLVPARSTAVDSTRGTVLDVNGDGFDDFLVGAPNAAMGAGTVHAYYGSTMVGSTQTTLTRLGLGSGAAVASAGDFDGDGFGDAIVGAPTDATGGWVALHRGRAGGLSANWSSGFSSATGMGASLSGAGDIDGDGYADIVVGNPTDLSGRGVVWLGYGAADASFGSRPRVSMNGPDAGGNFGASVASGADLNCDGHPDLVVGAPNAGTNGRVYVYYGNGTAFATNPSVTINAMIGLSIGRLIALGDYNGDGCADVAIAGSGSFSGAQVFMGSSSGLATSGTAVIAPLSLLSLASGDANGDGISDLYFGSGGDVRVTLGTASGAISGTFDTASGAQQFGTSVASNCDVNGDGYDDVVAGGPGGSAASGLVGIALSSGTRFTATITMNGTDGAGSDFGAAVALRALDRRRWFSLL